MKSPEEHLKRWLHPFIFAAWIVFLIYLLASRRYVFYLRPEFGLLLAVAYFVAMGFMIAAMIRPKTDAIDTSAIFRALVLLVPILYFMATPDTMLGHQAFKNRFIGTNNATAGRQVPSPPSFPELEADPGFGVTWGEMDDTRQTMPQEQTILDISISPNFYKGQRVIVTGMIMHDEQLKPHFGGRNAAVYRFLINCCAADALPLAIALDSGHADAFANDQWVQVAGIFDIQQINDKSVPIILKPQIKPVEAPAVPYLF